MLASISTTGKFPGRSIAIATRGKFAGRVPAVIIKTLLEHIQAALRNANALDHVSDTNIYISPDSLVFALKSYPQIIITANDTGFIIEDNRRWEYNVGVNLSLFQALKPDAQSLISHADPLVYGVLDIAGHVHDTLFDNKLSMGDVKVAIPAGETQSALVELDDIALLNKTLTYSYVLLTAKP